MTKFAATIVVNQDEDLHESMLFVGLGLGGYFVSTSPIRKTVFDNTKEAFEAADLMIIELNRLAPYESFITVLEEIV